jgi:phospholipase C
MEVRDPLHAERWEAADREGYLRRRDFLQRTAVTAGLAASAGLMLGPDTLVAEAARMQRRAPLPKPRDLPIDTFVVLIVENRSFDHFAGWFPVDDDGTTHQTHPLAPDYQGCGFNDPDHSKDVPFLASVARSFTMCDRFFCSLLGSTFPNREYMHAAQSYGQIDNSYPPQGGYPTASPTRRSSRPCRQRASRTATSSVTNR